MNTFWDYILINNYLANLCQCSFGIPVHVERHYNDYIFTTEPLEILVYRRKVEWKFKKTEKFNFFSPFLKI